MPISPFTPKFEDLPEDIPIFPLAGVLLLPRGTLPLNVFEIRYLNMVNDALAAPGRFIGMIQPTGKEDADALEESGGTPEVFPTGCAGRLISFSETGDGRFLITLNGVIRFDVAEELPLTRGYRRIRPDFSGYAADMDEAQPTERVDRGRLMAALEAYFKTHNIDPNWENIKGMRDRALVTSLSMGCPFDASEKQALLEAPGLAGRAEVLTTLLEMSSSGPESPGGESTRH